MSEKLLILLVQREQITHIETHATVGGFPCAPGTFLSSIGMSTNRWRSFAVVVSSKAHVCSAARATFDHPSRAPCPFALAAIGLRELLESSGSFVVHYGRRRTPNPPVHSYGSSAQDTERTQTHAEKR